jgi:thiamine kinase-like enzyme
MEKECPIIVFNQLEKKLSSYPDKTAITRYVSHQLKIKLQLSEEPIFEGFREVNCSYILRLRLLQENSDLPEHIYVKLFKKKVPNVNVSYAPFENSYKSMKQLCNLSKIIPSLVVQKPLIMLPEVNAVVMEWVNGTSLTEFMLYSDRFSSEKEKQRLEANFELLGRTMGFIHNQSLSLNENQPKFNDILTLNLNHLQNLLNNSYLKNSRTANHALTYLKKASFKNIATTWVHGDLSPTNVLLTQDNKIVLIDFEHSRFDSPYFDIGSFTVRASIYLGHNPLRFSHSYNNKLINKFLKGYFFSSNKHFSIEMLRYFQIFDLLQFILNHFWSSRDYLSYQNLFALFSLKSLCDYHRNFSYQTYYQ